MKLSTPHSQRQSSTILLNLLMAFLLCTITMNSSDYNIPPTLQTLDLQGEFTFHDISDAAADFGNRYRISPSANLRHASVSDISNTIRHIFEMGPRSELTLAARGHAHSLQGQAQASGGIVVWMESLKSPGIQVHDGNRLVFSLYISFIVNPSTYGLLLPTDRDSPYVEASGGELWIDVLRNCLESGMAPKSWTDYLHLTIGGTLSNAGISGQAFRHGPQISNVHQLEIVTGRGEVVNCSGSENADLFYGALGGLGQFGIITRARIAVEPAPKMVKWIRVLYSDFTSFTEDQEMLISSERTFDYIEGFVIINRTGLLNNWRSSFKPQDPVHADHFKSDGRTLFCLEMTKNFNPDEAETSIQEVDELLSKLRYIPSTLFESEVSYIEFLDRVHFSEVKLRSEGLWDVPHPWLNLLVPRARIHEFAQEVFGKILTDSSNGPILIYPLNKSKWDNRTSAVIPDDEIFYLVAFLSSVPSSLNHDNLDRALDQIRLILDFCEKANIGMKQYLPHYTTIEEWRAHFGSRWDRFVERKLAYDPLAILAPGQRIFHKGQPFS